MRVFNDTEFGNYPEESLHDVKDDGEVLVVPRRKGKKVVVMNLEEYHSMQETIYRSSARFF